MGRSDPTKSGNLAKTPQSLDGVSLLDCLSATERAGLERQCRWMDFGPGEKIIERGEEYSSVYFLITGTAHVLNYSESGRAVSYAALKNGDVFGELAAIDGLPRSAWVCTITDVSLLGAEQRVCMELIRMAEPDPNDPERYLVFPVPTQTNFANMIGASRETVSRILGRLRDDDIVQRTDKGLAIPDRGRLEQRALM